MNNDFKPDEDAMSRIITKWKDQLEAQYLAISETPNTYKRAYICSPCSAETSADVKRNVQAARFYMWYTYENMQLVAKAPHAYLPILLSDKCPAERALALSFGLKLLELSELMLVCGDRLTNGMKGEIAHAVGLNMPITVFDQPLYVDVRKLVTRSGGSKSLVTFNDGDTLLKLSPEGIFG